MSYAKGKNFNVVFLPLQYSAGDTYRGSGLVIINKALVTVKEDLKEKLISHVKEGQLHCMGGFALALRK